MEELEAFADYLRVQKRYSHRTLEIYMETLERFCRHALPEREKSLLTSADLAEALTPNCIRGFIAAELEGGIKPRTANLFLSALSSFCRFLVRRGVLKENPTEAVKRPKEEHRLPDFYREEDLKKYFQTPFEMDFPHLRNRTMLLLMYCTGIRRAEVATLKISDIDLSRQVLSVTGKGDKKRDIPMIPLLSEFLLLYLQQRKSSFEECSADNLFLTERGEPLYLSFVNNVVKKELGCLKEFSGKNHPHLLRHSFATHLLNNGAELNSIKEALGHSSLAATQVYTHNSFEKLSSIYREAHPLAKRGRK